MKIAVLASGEGSNFEAIVQATRSGILAAQVVGLVVNRPSAGALKRAERLHVPSMVINPREFSSPKDWDMKMAETLKKWQVDWVVLAGFLALIGPEVLKSYPNRIVNIHPALLPSFGGKGMYGQRVHEAVLAAGEKQSGITIHLVNEEYDRGPIVAQFKTPLGPDETVETLTARIHALEHEHYPRVLNDLITGRIKIG